MDHSCQEVGGDIVLTEETESVKMIGILKEVA
jgi:hypothetical protein